MTITRKNFKFKEIGYYPFDYATVINVDEISIEDFGTILKLLIPEWQVNIEHYKGSPQIRNVSTKDSMQNLKPIMMNKSFVCIKESTRTQDGILLSLHDGAALILIEKYYPYVTAKYLLKNLFTKKFWHTLLFKQNNQYPYGIIIYNIKTLWNILKNKDYRFIPVALLHTIGKPFAAYQTQKDIINKEYSFTDHEEVSYQIIQNYSFINQWTKDMVRYHNLLNIINTNEQNNASHKNQHYKKIHWELDDSFIDDLKQFEKYYNYS
jgi:hypothetical protein